MTGTPRFRRGFGMALRGIVPCDLACLFACLVPLAPSALAQTSIASSSDQLTPTTLVDSALAELSALAAEGVESSVLFGVPAPSQRQRAGNAAQRALSLLDQAQAAAATAVRGLEEGVMGQGVDGAEAARRAAAAEEALAQIVDIEQAQRIPFARGWAMTVLAAARDDASRAEEAKSAIDSLSALRLPGAGAEVSRRVMLMAAILNGGPGGVVDEASLAAITAEVRAIDSAGPTEGDSRTRVRLALIRRVLAPGDEHSTSGASTAELGEATARGLLIEARAAPQRRVELVAQACRELLKLITVGAGSAATVDPAARLEVYSKIATIIEPGIDTSALPPEAALARAVTLFRDHADSVEARALLAQVVKRADADPALKATALWESAAAQLRLSDSDSQAHAAVALDKLIGEFPRDERAPAAARSLESIAARLSRSPGLPAERRTEWEQMQLRALDLLIAAPSPHPFPTQLGEWKARAITLRVRRLDAATVTAEQIAPLIDLEAAIERRPPTPAHGPRQSAAGPVLAAFLAKVIDSPEWDGRDAAQRLGLVRVIRRLRDPLSDERLGLFAGEAQLALGNAPEAAAELRTLIGGQLDQPDEPTRPRVRLAYIDALRRAGLSETTRQEGLTLLRQLTAPIDEAVVSSPRPGWYWRAWADAVEIAATGAGADAAAFENVRAQIKRLEVIDPGLGGADLKERFEAVRRAHP